MHKNNLHTQIIQSPAGDLLAIATDTHLVSLEFCLPDIPSRTESIEKKWQARLCQQTNSITEQTHKELTEYFSGDRQHFTVAIAWRGTAFQERVWQALCAIPFGETWSYKQLAEHIGQPSACRAVANANNKNAIAIIVPCHRVISANGEIGGYAPGIEYKRQLLALEKPFSNFKKNHLK